MDTDDITLLGLRLAADPVLASQVAHTLCELHETRMYAAWAASVAQSRRFEVPAGIETSKLAAVGLVAEGKLQVKVNAFNDRVFITDGVWIDSRVRVFPFSDESELLVRHALSEGLHRWASCIVDLATGCGHNVIGLPGGKSSVAFDINPRALAYLMVNRALNRIRPTSLSTALNDIRDGIPPALARGLSGRTLFLANMPFALSPDATAMPLTSNGGPAGADLQLASFTAVLRFAEQARAPVKALFMSITVGNARTNHWQVVEQARRCFGAQSVRWRVLDGEKLLRVDGARELPNPVALRVAAPRIAACRLYAPDDDQRAQRLRAFAELACLHEAEGHPDIAFGIIDVNLDSGGPA